MFLRNEQAVLLFAVRVLFLFFLWQKSHMRSNSTTKTHLWWQILGNVACAFGTWNLNTKTTKGLVKTCYRKLCERNLPELTAKKAKFKIKNRTTKSAELINSARIGTIMCHYYVPNFVWLKQALSFLCGVCISRTSVLTQVNRHTNLHFSLTGHVHNVYVCMC